VSEELGIALVSREYPPFYGGGIGTYARWIVPALADAGMRVHVITEAHDQSHPRVEYHGPVTVHRLTMPMGRGGWTSAAARFSIHAGRKVAQLASRGEIDVAEFAECEGAAAALLLMRSILPGGVPATVVHLHTPSEVLFELRSLSTKPLDASLGAYFEMERLAIRLADRVCAPSRFIADWAEDHYQLPRAPAVIPYALAPAPSAAGPSASKRVLYAGRIEPRKGVEALILAWKGVHAAHSDAKLLLAGADTSGAPDGGSLQLYLLSLLTPAERASVRFLGRLRPEALIEEYAGAAVCVVPSLWENYPNTCIEAMLHARPVVVSDNGGMAEMIGESEAGLVCRAGDPVTLAAAIGRLLDEPVATRGRRGMIGRERILRLCDPARIAAARIEMYRHAVENASRGSVGARGGVLTEWKRCESLLAGELTGLALPTFDRDVARWIGVSRGDGTHAADRAVGSDA
jgi:glycosyltransferase involved in cell wall biosynthesis